MGLDLAVADLGPLAWVSEELRKSLDSATKALKRFARDAQASRGSDLAAIDTSQLRIARSQIHQAAGALEMVGFSSSCVLLHAMESAVAHFVDKPQNCTEQAAQTVESASFAVMEFLDATISSRAHSPVALFPQYKDIQTLAGQAQAHPADLWVHVWRWTDLSASLPAVDPVDYDASSRSRLDQSILAVMRGNMSEGGSLLCGVAQGLSVSERRPSAKAYWQIVAALGQALAANALTADLYLKRALPSIVQQFVALGKSASDVPERAGHDALFFCAQANSSQINPAGAAWFQAVVNAYRLSSHKPVDYNLRQYGNYDPAVLGAARKHLALFKDTWSSVSAGENKKSHLLQEQCNKVCDVLSRLYPAGQPLADGLRRTAQTIALSNQSPSAEVAMEVATVILFLEMVFEDFNPADTELPMRTAELAQRLAVVDSGGSSPPMLSWMEDLYRRFSEQGTLGSVVGELRTSLSELEKNFDLYFRDPAQVAALSDAPARLTQMRGVMTVLGLDQAALAVIRMRDWIEEILKGNVSHEAASVPGGYFEKVGSSLGALGFQFDMLGYQPSLAKNLFVYDEQSGELKPVMGRTAAPDLMLGGDGANAGEVRHPPEAAFAMPSALMTAAPAAEPKPLPVAQEADVEEDDLLGIFLEEAREVIESGQSAIDALHTNPADMELRTSLRRCFHTLKGSSRMVGLGTFGEAAWAMEQAHNASLADAGPCRLDLLDLSTQALSALASWTQLVATQGMQAGPSSADAFKRSAEALRLQGIYEPLEVPAELTSQTAASPEDVPAEPVDLADFSLVFNDTPPLAVPVVPPVAAAFEPTVEMPTQEAAPAGPDLDFSFDLISPSAEEEGAAGPDVDPVQAEPMEFAAGDLPVIMGEETQPPSGAEPPPEPDLVFDLSDVELIEVGAPSTTPDLTAGLMPDAGQAPDWQSPQVPLPEVDLLADSHLPVEMPPEQAVPVQDEIVPRDNVKVIGDLEINLALYNVYLSEADEWSRQLLADINETALDTYAMPSDNSVAWAHTLAGSSATVGCESLSELARELEYALIQSQRQGAQTPQLMALFIDAAEAIRRSLHQFAAGFMPKSETALIECLKQAQIACSVPTRPMSLDEPEPPGPFELPGDAVDFVLSETPGQVSPGNSHAELAPADFSLPEPDVQQQPVVEHEKPDPAPAEAPVFADRDDDFDVVDAIDPELFPIFEEEAAELMPNLGAALRQWVGRADNYGARSEALRLMHTLKGSARLAGALRLGEMIHHMESDVEHLGSAASAAQLEPLIGGFDRISEVFDALRARDAQAYQQALDNTRTSPPTSPVAGASGSAAPAASAPPAAGSARVSIQSMTVGNKRAQTLPREVTAPTLAVRSSNQSVRVRSNLLDRMVNQAGEVMMTRSRLEAELGNLRGSLTDLTANLDKLRQQLRDIELQAETQMQSRMAQSRESQANFDPLEFDRYTRVQELTRMMAESVNDVATVQRNLDRALQATEDNLTMQARQTRELQGDLLRTRMVEFEGISERLYRVVRLASKETGKQVRLDITGGQIEMDRGMLDRLTPAFEHLLRNCVAHGIEDAVVRQNAGKDPAGLITIALSQEGNDVNLEFRDDGAGLNIERIRDKAISLGLVSPHAGITPAQAADFIFNPGFSTASEVTELAGRGIGMDVVRNEIVAIGGRIDTRTEPGKGTSFKLVLPLTTAVTQVVMVRSGDLIVGVPSTLVEIVRRTSPRELEMAYNSGQLEVVAGESIPFFWSGALLQSSQRSLQPVGRSTPVMIFRSAAQRVALHVDEVLGNQEVVVKNL
ncbi:MAG: hypothetical protein RLZZ271_225, partial [Pseudomonadota bacterium]